MASEKVVLIVDDSQTMRQLLLYALSSLGNVRSVQAENGEQALAALGAHKIDLVLTDLNMPVMDGLTLLQRIRSQPALKSLPVVMITTESASDEITRAQTLGATDYVKKPIRKDAITAVIRKHLGP